MSLPCAIGVLASGSPVVVGDLAVVDSRSDVVMEDMDEGCDVIGWGWGNGFG